MPEYTAVVIEKIVGSLTTDDGLHMLLKVSSPGGRELELAFPFEALGHLLEAAARSSMEGAKAQKLDSRVKPAFPVSWWELGLTHDGNVVLSLTLSSGAILVFNLDRQMATGILETLQVHVGGGSLPKPERLD
jgi:hypothetical protein